MYQHPFLNGLGGEDLAICLMWSFFGWQLGRLRSWVRVTLMILSALGALGTVLQVVSFLLPGHLLPIHNADPLYYIVVDGIPGIIQALLLYFLTRPIVLNTFRAPR